MFTVVDSNPKSCVVSSFLWLLVATTMSAAPMGDKKMNEMPIVNTASAEYEGEKANGGYDLPAAV